ncbi:MAG: hypothetical protein IJM32_04590 [Ruminococcus sp.]|nr:hypothetical protein [Ruminococcus sp.]
MTIIVLYILLGIIALIVILLHFSVRATIKASKQGVDIKVKWLFFTFYPRKPKKPKKPKKKKGEPDAVPEQTAEQPDLSENGIEQFIKEAEEVQKQTAAEEKTEETQETAAKEETASAKSETKDNKKEKEKAKEPKPKEKPEKEKGKLAQLKDKFNAIKPYIPTGWKYFKKLLKKIRFTNIEADVTVGKEDAYEAAVWYGKVQGILFGLFGWLSCIFTVKLKHVDVHCRFNEKITDGEISLKVKVRPSTMIHIAFCLGFNFLRIWLRQRRERKRRIKAIRKKRQQALKQKQMKVNNTQKG